VPPLSQFSFLSSDVPVPFRFQVRNPPCEQCEKRTLKCVGPPDASCNRCHEARTKCTYAAHIGRGAARRFLCPFFFSFTNPNCLGVAKKTRAAASKKEPAAAAKKELAGQTKPEVVLTARRTRHATKRVAPESSDSEPLAAAPVIKKSRSNESKGKAVDPAERGLRDPRARIPGGILGIQVDLFVLQGQFSEIQSAMMDFAVSLMTLGWKIDQSL
jgi:hypothetical protein